MKVKVNRVRGGSMGDQRNYGLVTGSIWNYEDKPSTNSVSGTMTPTSREDATIEAERGETVVGDLNNDGQLEHLKIGGKRHSQGGTPLNVPDGSFVFSDYNGLLIKNKELLANVFNYKSGKSATPAKVASRYELNRYNDILNDPNADFLDQKTAQLMIDNNLKKLGQLALVQESMKGFPDGIPNISLPLFGSDMQAGGSMPQMKKGGLVKAQKGKNVAQKYWQNKFQGSMPDTIPVNQVIGPKTVRTQWDNPNFLSDFALAASSPFATLMSTGYKGDDWRDYVMTRQDNPIDMAIQGASMGLGRVPAYFYNALPFLMQQEYGGQYMQNAGEKKKEEQSSGWGVPALGALGAIGTTVAYPYIKSGVQSVLGPIYRKVWKGTEMVPFETTNRKGRTYTVDLPEETGMYKYIRPYLTKQNLAKLGKYGIIGGLGAGAAYLINRYFNAPEAEAAKAGAMSADPYALDTTVTATPAFTTLDQATEDYFNRLDTTQKPVNVAGSTSAPQDTGRRQPVSPARVNTPRNAAVIDSSVLEFMSKQYGGYVPPIFQTAGQFAAYTEPSKITSNADWEVVSPTQSFPYKFGVQSFDPSLGTYTVAGPDGKNVALNLSDLYNRLETTEQETGLPIIKNYDKGVDQWKKDITSSDIATRKKAVGHAQRAYNDARIKLGLSPYFYGKAGTDPYGIDEMLGLYTFSMPGLRKKKKAEPAPSVPAAPAAPVAGAPDYTGPGFQASQRPRSLGWAPENVAGFMTATGQMIPDYLLTTAVPQASMMGRAYSEFDPSAIMGAYQAYLQNVGTGPQGKGAALSATGATGKTLEALNRERQANRAANLDVFLKTSAADQQALNQFNLYGAEERKAYVDRANAINNALTQDMNQKLAQITEQFSKGESNERKLKNLNAIYPYQYSDWSGTTVNPTLRGIYDEPILGSTAAGSSYDTMFNTIFNKLIEKGVSADKAAAAAADYATGATRASKSGYGTSGAASSIYDFMT